jgi:hypothetical protein
MLLSQRIVIPEVRDTGRYDNEVIRKVIRFLEVEEAMLDTTNIARSDRDRPLQPGAGRGTDYEYLQYHQLLRVPEEVDARSAWKRGQPRCGFGFA